MNATQQPPTKTADDDARKTAIAPDKKKIAAYAIAVSAIDIPIGTTIEGKHALAKVGTVIDAALAEIRTIYTALK